MNTNNLNAWPKGLTDWHQKPGSIDRPEMGDSMWSPPQRAHQEGLRGSGPCTWEETDLHSVLAPPFLRWHMKKMRLWPWFTRPCIIWPSPASLTSAWIPVLLCPFAPATLALFWLLDPAKIVPTLGPWQSLYSLEGSAFKFLHTGFLSARLQLKWSLSLPPHVTPVIIHHITLLYFPPVFSLSPMILFIYLFSCWSPCPSGNINSMWAGPLFVYLDYCWALSARLESGRQWMLSLFVEGLNEGYSASLVCFFIYKKRVNLSYFIGDNNCTYFRGLLGGLNGKMDLQCPQHSKYFTKLSLEPLLIS